MASRPAFRNRAPAFFSARPGPWKHMKALYKRLAAKPHVAAELAAATLLINILAFADIIYVMLILRRYITYGFDGTLFILTLGALAALGLQLACKEARTVLARQVAAGGDEDLARRGFRALVASRVASLLALPQSRTRDLPSLLGDSQSGADATVVCAAMDFPFSFVFVAATAVLHPVLGLVVLVGAWMALATASRTRKGSLETATTLQEETAANRSLIASAAACADTVRVFRGSGFYKRLWREQVARLGALRGKATDQRTLVQSSQATVSVFVRVAVYAVGAKLVVDGELTFASLIGASMLGSYAVAKASMLVQAQVAVARAREAEKALGEVLDLPREPSGGLVAGPLAPGKGLVFRDMGFAFPGSRQPLFQGFDLDVAPGALVVAHGYNGSGKTTLARLAAGIIRPDQGDIWAGGVSLAEADADAWRSRLVYMPQEPDFLVATVRENLTMANPGLDEAELNRILRLAGLRSFLDTSELGLEAPMPDAGRGLPLGIRRRMALARAMATGGDLVILDEPTEGLDADGVAAIYAALKEFMEAGRTILAFTADPAIRRAAHMAVDLGVKPMPAVTVLRAVGPGAGREPGGQRP